MREIIPVDYFLLLENEFHQNIESPAECNDLCENEITEKCDSFVFNARKFTCQLGQKCAYCRMNFNAEKTTFQVKVQDIKV